MEQIIVKLKDAVHEMATEKGEFTLVALLHRKDSALDRWELLVSASWIPGLRLKILRYIADKLKIYLQDDELVKLARIVPLEPSSEFVIELNRLFQIKQRNLEEPDFILTGLELDYVHIIVSNPTVEMTIV